MENISSFIFIGLQVLSASEEILIQSFSTSIEKQNLDVRRNLSLAVEKLNGITIEPNKVFFLLATLLGRLRSKMDL